MPSIRPFHPNEFNACIKIQKITRGYLTRRTLAAINWTNDQLKAPQLTNRFFENEDNRKPTLLFKIAKKEIVIPNHLSLSLIIKFLNLKKHNKNFKGINRVNYKDDRNWTPLHWASTSDNLEVVKCLIENKANLEAKDFLNNTPLHLAIKDGNPEIAKVLIENGADLNTIGGGNNTPLHLAIKNGNPEIAKVLIENKPNLEAKDLSNNTPLHLAIKNGNPEIAKVLIENKANLEAKDLSNNTPLHLAIKNGNPEIAKVLIENKANLEAKDLSNNTPLHLAIKNRNPEIAKVLIEKGADLNAKGEFDNTPLHSALRYGHLDIAKQLKIIDHLDNNDSIDSLTSDIENLTADQIKSYYKIHQEEIDSLMKQRKIYRIALSIIHTPEKVELNHDLNQENIINATLFYTRAFNRFRFLPASGYFPIIESVDKNTKIPSWKFIMEGLQFFQLKMH